MVYEDDDLEDLDRLFGKNELDSSRMFSFSRLSDFDRNGPVALIKRSVKKTHSLMIGSLVDDMVNEDIDINDIYFRYDGEKPTATLGKLTNIILDNYTKLPNKKEVLNIVKKNGYWSNTKNEETLMQKFDIPAFWDYLKTMFNSKDKIIVTTNDFILADDLATTVKTHDFTKDLFKPKKNVKVFYQIKFDIKYNNIIIKGVIDIVIIDYKNKTITLIDLKTGKDNALEFSNSFIKYRYYLQAAIYSKAFDFICDKFKLNKKQFKLNPFEFLYISKSEKIPILYKVSKKWNNAAINGFTTSYGYKYRGLDEIIDDVKWHLKNKVFDMPKNIYITKGNLTLNDNFIKLMDE